jgi:hypothetical protein
MDSTAWILQYLAHPSLKTSVLCQLPNTQHFARLTKLRRQIRATLKELKRKNILLIRGLMKCYKASPNSG